MATVGGNNSVRDGLVFYYDTGNKYRSFKGEPTTNLIPNVAIPTLSTTGWTEHGWQGDFQIDTKENALELTSINGWHNATYDTGITSGGTITISFNYKIKYQQTPGIYMFVLNGRDLGVHTTHFGYTYNLPRNSWGRYVHSFTANSDSKICIGLRGTDNAGLTDKLLIKNLQVELKDYDTPFVNGTRSNTESLFDLSSNSVLDVSNVSFDSDGMFYDRPSYNRINTYFGNGIDPTVTTFTVEAIVKAKILQTNPMWVSTTGWGNNQRFYSSITTSDTRRTGYQGVLWQSGDIPDLLWHHQVITMDGTNIKCFDNGELVYTGSYTSYTLPSDIYFGSGNNTHSWDGQIPVAKIYNKALTTDEVKRNFNSYKGRFNL